MNNSLKELVNKYYRNWTAAEISNSGSSREYYRISYAGNKSVIAVYSPNEHETKAFLSFTKTFNKAGVKVPQILFTNEDTNTYILSDLGNISLFNIITSRRTKNLNKETLELCCKALEQLAFLQFEASKSIDYTKAYPTGSMNTESLMWDLNYFKYNFLKLTGIDFDERALEKDFQNFAGIIMQIQPQSFVYRDFQSRNIMVNDDGLWFIDYQGGRKGPCVYDLVSFIYQAKANISPYDREQLIQYYYKQIKKYVDYNRKIFKRDIKFVRLLRAMQTLGAYGFRGIIEKKPHFVQSLNLGIENFIQALEDCKIENLISPEISKLAEQLQNKYLNENVSLPKNDEKEYEKRNPITLEINSFSYKYNNIPKNENGGGFVFDCRCLPNPFWEEKLKYLSGLDNNVRYYFNSKPEVEEFINNIKNIIDFAINDYYNKGYESLMISFGCTGGKHRSVYCADKISLLYKNHDKVKTKVKHLRKESW